MTIGKELRNHLRILEAGNRILDASKAKILREVTVANDVENCELPSTRLFKSLDRAGT